MPDMNFLVACHDLAREEHFELSPNELQDPEKHEKGAIVVTDIHIPARSHVERAFTSHPLRHIRSSCFGISLRKKIPTVAFS